eukprot:g2725.t1
MYKESEDEGLYDANFPNPVLGFEMRAGLIVRTTKACPKVVQEGDRLWRIDNKKVQGWSDERLIKELMSHHKRPLKLTFLHPARTNPDVRHGIVATETKRFHAVTKGNLKGLPSFASFAGNHGVSPGFRGEGAGGSGAGRRRGASSPHAAAPPGGFGRDAPDYP